ncbi:MAG: bifunctional nuclease family protein [Candidatus Aenigmatarchaeota archaeon]
MNREIIFFAIAIAVLIFSVYSFLKTQNINLKIGEEISLPDISTVGYSKFTVEASVTQNTGIVTLTSGCYQIVANTEPHQALSIADGMAGKIGFRPNTHDLIAASFKNLGIKVLMVKIVDLRNNTFIADLILQQGDNILTLDARPSDAIALAVRMNVTNFYIKDEILKTQGRNIC